MEGLNCVERAISYAANLDILKSVLMEVRDNKLFLTATNLEFAVQKTIPSKIINKGKAVVPFSVLNHIAKNINSEKVSVESKNKKIIVSTESYEAVIQAQDPEDFPVIPKTKNKESSIKTIGSVVNSAIKDVVVATQYSETRPEISGVLFRFREGKVVLVATDSFRLSERRLNEKNIDQFVEGTEFILPIKTAEEVMRIFEDDEVMDFQVDKNQVFIYNKTKEMTSRVIDGTFPEYEGIIPSSFKTTIKVPLGEVVSAIKLTSTLSSKTNEILLSSGEGNKVLEIYSKSDSMGENRYKIPTKTEGGGFKVAFNWRYLLDGLLIYKEEEEVVFGFNAPDKPVVIKSQNRKDLVYVIMPVKT